MQVEYLFVYYDFGVDCVEYHRLLWSNPLHSNVPFIDWLEYIWTNINWYNKIYGSVLEKIFTIL